MLPTTGTVPETAACAALTAARLSAAGEHAADRQIEREGRHRAAQQPGDELFESVRELVQTALRQRRARRGESDVAVDQREQQLVDERCERVGGKERADLPGARREHAAAARERRRHRRQQELGEVGEIMHGRRSQSDERGKVARRERRHAQHADERYKAGGVLAERGRKAVRGSREQDGQREQHRPAQRAGPATRAARRRSSARGAVRRPP